MLMSKLARHPRFTSNSPVSTHSHLESTLPPKAKARSRFARLRATLVGALAVTGLLSACAAEVPDTEAVGSQEDAYCSNLDGVNATLAALAVSIARELGRWQIPSDFTIVNVNGQQQLVLSSVGKSHCADGVCANTQTLLGLQDPRMDQQVIFPDGQKLSSWALSSRLVSGYQAQATCDTRPDNHRADNCPAEAHKLTMMSQSQGVCAMNDSFRATSPTGAPLVEPAQLRNKLLWAGGSGNPYLAFSNVGDMVTIDPTPGLNEGDYTAFGACEATCTKISFRNIAGQCCSCNGRSGKMRSVSLTNLYVCR
jgi:hypothetical protein